MNNQYLNTFTGTETVVPIFKPENSRGAGEIKVKTFGTGYIDSDETTKQVWFGPPAVYAFGNHLVNAINGAPMYDFCYGTHNDCQAVHPAGEAFIEEWQWQGTSATIYPYGYAYQYATIYPNDYSSFGVEIRARNECGWSEWSRIWVIAIDCSNYYMIISPNPADSYVELNFIEEMGVKDKTNKIKIKKAEKNMDGNLDEYLIQILDKNGTIRKSTQSNSMKLNIPTRDLEPGNYFLHLTTGAEVYKQQLIIY